MRTGIICMLLATAASSGCANMYKQRVNQQLWERELRLQEDCIYRLRWQLEDTHQRLEEANQRLATANKETDVLRDRSGGPDLNVPPSLMGPSGASGSGRGSDAPKLPPAPGSPLVEPGQEFTPGTPPPPNPAGKSGASGAPLELRGPKVSPAGFTEANPLRLSEKLDPDVEVERIILNADQTGQLKPVGKSGVDRLNVVIEQRDADDKRVLAPGDVSIVVVDPALDGAEARIARWNFESDEVAKHVRRNRDGGSLQFELPWPTPPAHSDLRLFVRFTSYDGRRLEANLPIEAQLAGGNPSSQDWRKSARSADPDDASRNAATESTPATASKTESNAKTHSVYEAKDADASPSPDSEEPPREAKRNRPAWSPFR